MSEDLLWRNSVLAGSIAGAFIALCSALIQKGWLEGKLERLRGTIRADVERDLKYQESRLRVATELEIKLHDREWQSLDELSRVLHDLLGIYDRVSLSFVSAVMQNKILTREWQSEHGVKLATLQAWIPRVPDAANQDVEEIYKLLDEVRGSISQELAQLFKGLPTQVAQDRNEWVSANHRRVEKAREVANRLQREWGARLRQANARILTELRSQNSG